MDAFGLFYMALRWMPFFIAFAYTILLVIHLFRHTTVPLTVRIIPILALLTVIINWLYANQLYYLHTLRIPVVPLLFLSASILPVLFYQLTCRLTRLRPDERFSKWHYLMPGFVFVVTSIWSFLNLDKALPLSSFTEPVNVRLVFPGLFYDVIFLRMIVSLIYIVPSLMRIRRYRKEVVNYSSDEYRISLRWLLILVLIFGIQIIVTMGMCLSGFGKNLGQVTNPLLLIFIILFIWQMTLMTYNILNGNFEIVANGNNCVPVTDKKEENNVLPTEQQVSFKQKLEGYLENNKSYLKPDLRITELTAPLATSRTYLSTFINETYSMNFCRFINLYRLKEYERLRADETNRECSNTELAIQAGFSNYVGLYRTKAYRKEMVDDSMK